MVLTRFSNTPRRTRKDTPTWKCAFSHWTKHVSLDNGHALIRGYTLNLNTQRPINGTPIYLLSWELCTLGLML